MATLLTDVTIEEVSLVDEPANPHAQILLMKRKPKCDKADCDGSCEECMADAESKSARKPKGESMAEDLATVQAELAKARADSDAKIEALTKRLDEQAANTAKVEAELAKAKEAADANAAKATEFEKRANEERDARELSECIALGKSRYGTLPLAEDEKGKLIKALKTKLTTEEYAAVTKLFESHETALKQLRVPPGSTGSANEGSAYGKIQTMAKARAEKDGITLSKAMIAISRENPDLYREAQSEGRAN